MKKFDLTTHKRNSKGIITSRNPYRLYVRGNTKVFERPPGSKNMYYENGELISGPIFDGENAAKAEKAALEKVMAEVVESATRPVLEVKKEKVSEMKKSEGKESGK